jgi:hypothetical protein
MVVGWMTRGSPSGDMELTPLKQVKTELLTTPIRRDGILERYF